MYSDSKHLPPDRTERLHPFTDQEEVEDTLRRMAGRQEPVVARLERQPAPGDHRQLAVAPFADVGQAEHVARLVGRRAHST